MDFVIGFALGAAAAYFGRGYIDAWLAKRRAERDAIAQGGIKPPGGGGGPGEDDKP